MNILPILSSNFSIGKSILSLEPETKSGPDSIFSIAKEYGLKDIYLCDTSISGFIEFYKNANKLGLNARFGLKMVVTDDGNKKDEESLANEHNVILWVLNSDGYRDLSKIYTKAATDFFYYQPRIDQTNLEIMVNPDNISLSIPFYDSFLFKNTMTFSQCVFDCSKFNPSFFVEKGNNLPFDPLIEAAISNFDKEGKYERVAVKSIFYKNRSDFMAWQTFRCIHNRSTLSKPELRDCCSAEFCMEAWKELSV